MLKKIAFLLSIIIIFVGNINAFQWGLGYNNGVSARFWYNDDFGSEIGLDDNPSVYFNDYFTVNIHPSVHFVPLIFKIFKSQYIDISSSVSCSMNFFYQFSRIYSIGLTDSGGQISLIFPSIEIRLPFKEDLSLTCDLLRLYYTWQRNNVFFKGGIVAFQIMTLSNIGLFYYF